MILIEKAFDTISHDISMIGFSDNAIKWFQSYISNRILFFLINWDSLHARLNSHYIRHGVIRKRNTKR